METYIAKLLTAEVLSRAAKLADTDSENLKSLGSFENFVFEFAHKNGNRVLRLTHSSHRSQQQIASELDFVSFLSMGGARVAQPLPLTNGEQVACLAAPDGSYFIVSVFRKVDGVGKEGFDLEPAIVQDWGRITGQMHRLAKAYKPSAGIKPRYEWHEDPLVQNGLGNNGIDAIAKRRVGGVLHSIQALPRTPDTFGLIHTDLHHGNFFVHHKQVVAFDFDDCCYHYFVQDIAIPLYYAFWKGYGNMDKQAFAAYFLHHFTKGYELEQPLPSGWQQQLPLFLQLRDFVLYAVLAQKLDPATADEKQLATLQVCKQRACGITPLLDFDITALDIGQQVSTPSA